MPSANPYLAPPGRRVKPAPTISQTDACDCGDAKSYRAQACDRCIYLDGKDTGGIVIAALRRAGQALSIKELENEIAIDYRQIYRSIQRMLVSGRVRKFEEEFQYDTRRRNFGRDLVETQAMGNRWLYALTEAP